MTETIFTNARLILADEVLNGTIAFTPAGIVGISSGRSSLPCAIDVDGDHVAPGLVELHTDNMERHVTPRPNAHWPAASAAINHDREIAAAGITTVYNAFSIGQIHPSSRRLDTLTDMCHAVEEQQALGHLKADHYLHLRCEVSYGPLMELLEPIVEGSNVRLMSVMDHTPGQRQFVSLDQYATYYQGKYKLSDAELKSFIADRVADQKRYSAENRRKTVNLAHAHGIPLASHDDAEADHVAEAVRDRVTIAEFPTTREAAELSHAHGLAVLMGAPNLVRGASHNGNLSARELAAHGTLDILSSDYVPSALLYAALLAEETVEDMTLAQAIRVVTKTPAHHAGFDDRGEIAQGLRADIVRFHRTQAGPIIKDVWREGRRVA